MYKKCIYVVILNNWFPELCNITLPLIKAWGDKIEADLKIIDTPKFPGWPPNYERLQIYELGKQYFWNINMDADYIINPYMLEDPTHNGHRDPTHVYIEGGMKADYYFNMHPYFLRDGRNQGVGDAFVVSSYMTHDIWTPLDMAYDEAKTFCIREERQVSEFCLSLNLARYGLKFDGAVENKDYIYHISSTGKFRSQKETLALAKSKIKEMGL